MSDLIHRVRSIVLRYGWNTTCFQLVNPKLSFWLGEEAVIGYVRKAGYAVVAGAPVCPPERLPEILEEWEGFCATQRLCTSFFGAEARVGDATRARPGYSRVILGAQPIWSPPSLVDKVDRTKSLRAQINRARNKHVVVEEWDTARATRNPELQRILDEWLRTRGLPTMHFLVEPETLDHLEGRRTFVAVRNGTPVAFLGLSPIPARNGWLTEQFPRGHDAPNGSVELLMYEATRKLCDEGATMITMGIVPLARMKDIEPRWLRWLARWARAHGRRFYNFEGLEWFKDKFQPDDWEPIYTISNEAKFSMRTLYAIAAAFTDSPPPIVLFKALGRALRREILRR